MSKLFEIPISKQLFTGLFMLLLQVMVQAQEETVTDNKGNIIKVRNTVVTTATSAPTAPLQNDIWFDTTANLTKIYDGGSWIVINADALALKENTANKSSDVTLADATNTKFPTELAVKTYVDGQLTTTADDDWYQEGGTDPATDIDQNIYTMGNVGIGVTTPDSKLHINETVGTVASAMAGSLLLEHQNSGGASSIVFKSKVNSDSDYGYIQFSDDGSGNGNTAENALLEIGIQNDVIGTYQDDIALMPSGNVGIGTRTPTAKLDIESDGVPLKITPSTTTPTGTQAGQIFMGTDGILYAYDGARAKWLSVDRNTVSWSRGSTGTSNEYLRAHDASPSSNNGYRVIRNATITAVAAQTNTNETWNLLILKNDGNVSITFLTMTNETGKHENNTNINVDEGDFIQAYCLGSNINHPLASIEFAWRK